MGIREIIAIKRAELSLMEADARIEDLEAEIEKIREKRVITETNLTELKGEQ